MKSAILVAAGVRMGSRCTGVLRGVVGVLWHGHILVRFEAATLSTNESHILAASNAGNIMGGWLAHGVCCGEEVGVVARLFSGIATFL